jgi:hypothetical protein
MKYTQISIALLAFITLLFSFYRDLTMQTFANFAISFISTFVIYLFSFYFESKKNPAF